jgi:phospholipid N-methyltransferase
MLALMRSETEKIKERYEKRNSALAISENVKSSIYNQCVQAERELFYNTILNKCFKKVPDLKVLEIGAGTGINLYFLLKKGFIPGNIYANELLEERVSVLESNFPNIHIDEGDACQLKYIRDFDVVFQSLVFTSILDRSFRRKLAERMWQMKKSEGIILWYDFIYNNPSNSDVNGVKKREVVSLFPNAKHFEFRKVTLAPPIGRRIGEFYFLINTLLPFLRTHLAAVIR